MIELLQIIVIAGILLLFFLSIVGLSYHTDNLIISTPQERTSLLDNSDEEIINDFSEDFSDNSHPNIDKNISQRKIDLNYVNKLI